MAVHPSVLQQFPLLLSLPAERLASLAALAALRPLAKRELALRKGETPTFLGFLLEGRLQAVDFTLDGREVGLYFVEPGGYFGEIALLDDLPQPEMIIASARTQVVQLPAAALREEIYTRPEIMKAITRGLTGRIRALSMQRQVLGIINPLQRIVAHLQSLGTPDGQSRIVVSAPTHQEMAIMINLTRETVTRTFQVLLAKGALQRDGDKLVMDVARLRQLSEQGS